MSQPVYTQRYQQLNEQQRRAVDHIDGPLLIIAGPGTGKTELLSMRAATILERTDTLASSILCLTFTDSGAAAMRQRLSDIIGADAYKVAIHTFHSFGSEIMNQHAEYFFRGAQFKPADELVQYEIVRGIFDELDYTNPLAGMNGDEYTHLRDVMTAISELKRSGLSSDELRQVLDANDAAIEPIERDLIEVFQNRVSKTTVHLLAPLAKKAAEVEQPVLPPGITPYANVLALSLAHAIDAAIEADSTKPITAWKSSWCEKNERGETVLRDRRRHNKLRALAHIYYQYLVRMEAAGLYDYDDMILQVIHALETQPGLRANLQEKYQYIMVDEFQDTNLAQLRLLFDITGDDAQANVMAVGDDDQAIYSFQGADVGNIQRFRTQYGDPSIIVLKDNYRSAEPILEQARAVISQGSDRLENSNDSINKQLVAHAPPNNSAVKLDCYHDIDAERQGIARQIRQLIDSGTDPASIAVLARRHHELIALLPHLAHAGVRVDYERRENVLEHELVQLLEHLCMIIDALQHDAHDEADALLPEILAHPAFGYNPRDIYRLSLSSYRQHQLWLETMQTMPVFTAFANWLLVRSAAIHSQPLEQQIDELIGTTVDTLSEQPLEPESEAPEFHSPLYHYFFSPDKLADQPDAYLTALEALRTIRDQLREHAGHDAPTMADFLEFLTMHRQLGSVVTAVRRRSDAARGLVNLMSAHKAKGLEFDHVFVIGAIDSAWGERVRGRSRLISYPANLPLSPAGDSFDERLRLFFVAMTRARRNLYLSYAAHDSNGKDSLIASFLADLTLTATEHAAESDIAALQSLAELDWRAHLVQNLDTDIRELLTPQLERYKLSSTHLGNFLDVARGGPQAFLLNNLLRFPQAKSAHASYGTAVHATLQRAHDLYRATKERRPLEDVLGDYERILADQHLTPSDHEVFLSRGSDALGAFLSAKYDSFTPAQQTELGFGSQSVMVGDARLTGALDLVDIDKTAKTIVVTDYKTGKPSRDWKGKTEYEKMKLHRYRQQLMFYQLLVEGSRDYSQYRFQSGVLQFVEPTQSGDIVSLELNFSEEKLDEFRKLIMAVWQRIMTLDLPDTSQYEPSLKGILQFEADLLDALTQN